uniref:LytTR family DNA-binding domain-containing protein n=1 Tax=Roseihalotalea indica TaxID=2867963 RepID=A0AA49GL37_9BACT|nr:LytTR family DNA-binding domain-containing protein [Tunicatimonas sp. TK19036]
MISTIALDDETPALKVIENFCHKIDFIDLHKTFTSTSQAKDHLNNYPVDLIFLDINMPAISGIDFHQIIPPETMVIFTTAYSEYAVEGFNLKAVDYLLKPFTLDRFAQAVEKAKDLYQFTQSKTEQRYLFIRADYSLIKIDTEAVLYVEAMEDYLRIRLKGQKPVVARMTMKAMEEKLPAADFARVHRSYIVNIRKIEQLRGRIVTIDGKELPVSKGYLDNLKQSLRS